MDIEQLKKLKVGDKIVVKVSEVDKTDDNFPIAIDASSKQEDVWLAPKDIVGVSSVHDLHSLSEINGGIPDTSNLVDNDGKEAVFKLDPNKNYSLGRLKTLRDEIDKLIEMKNLTLRTISEEEASELKDVLKHTKEGKLDEEGTYRFLELVKTGGALLFPNLKEHIDKKNTYAQVLEGKEKADDLLEKKDKRKYKLYLCRPHIGVCFKIAVDVKDHIYFISKGEAVNRSLKTEFTQEEADTIGNRSEIIALVLSSDYYLDVRALKSPGFQQNF